ncbi:hypothetical protein HY065_03455 [Candidatus Berkelbacteria bacterium]|nr:hypothetical protein [Candidatus Berkelbacteria bacterium]
MDELEQLHKMLADTAVEMILGGLVTREEFELLDELYRARHFRELDALKCSIAQKMADGLLNRTVSAQNVDVLCSAHPARPLTQQYELSEIYKDLYGLLAGIASRARDILRQPVEELTNKLAAVNDCDALQVWINETVTAKIFSRDEKRRLSHNPNIPGAKFLYQQWIMKWRHLDQLALRNRYSHTSTSPPC